MVFIVYSVMGITSHCRILGYASSRITKDLIKLTLGGMRNGEYKSRLCAPLQQLKDEHISLRAEMVLFYEIAEEIECESGPAVVSLFAELYARVSAFTEDLKVHSKREEEGLFPLMVRRLGKNDHTIDEMEEEHEKEIGRASCRERV